jgi:hypothetical protein
MALRQRSRRCYGSGHLTAGDILLQIEIVRVTQFAWHAVASAKEGRSRFSCGPRSLRDRHRKRNYRRYSGIRFGEKDRCASRGKSRD